MATRSEATRDRHAFARAAQVRPELKFDSLDELIKEISADGVFCEAALDEDAHNTWPKDPYFRVQP